jgi:hypothetical protein
MFNGVRKDSLFLEGYRKIINNIFIPSSSQARMLDKFSNESCERRYNLWIGRMFDKFFCLASKDSKNNLISKSSCITFISEIYFKKFTTYVMAKVGSPSNFG